MIYVHSMNFPDADRETSFTSSIRETCYDSFYPFGVLSKNRLEELIFSDITILYGGNGSGKSTALNAIAEKIIEKSRKTLIKRDSIFNKSSFYYAYIKMCYINIADEPDLPKNNRIITSDDVFDYLLNMRALNEGIDEKRKEIFAEYAEAKNSNFKLRSLADYEELKKVNEVRRKSSSSSKFVRRRLMDNIRGYSNGESAFKYFIENIAENGIYLLDEPENSLSPKLQAELTNVIEDYARFFGCQFIISTHSPFLLSLRGAKIYDLDENPVAVKGWTELENVRAYHDFFTLHKDAFGPPGDRPHESCARACPEDPMKASRVRKMHRLENENRKLKQMFADASLENVMLKGSPGK